jgi:hypothetical protein
MRGGGDGITALRMIIKNVGNESIKVELWSETQGKWVAPLEIPPNMKTKPKNTSVGAAWRVTGHTAGTKELSWVLGDDGSKQEIHVDFTPSNGSLTWTASNEEVDAQARAQSAISRSKMKRTPAPASQSQPPLSLRDAALLNPVSLTAQAYQERHARGSLVSPGGYSAAYD